MTKCSTLPPPRTPRFSALLAALGLSDDDATPKAAAQPRSKASPPRRRLAPRGGVHKLALHRCPAVRLCAAADAAADGTATPPRVAEQLRQGVPLAWPPAACRRRGGSSEPPTTSQGSVTSPNSIAAMDFRWAPRAPPLCAVGAAGYPALGCAAARRTHASPSQPEPRASPPCPPFRSCDSHGVSQGPPPGCPPAWPHSAAPPPRAILAAGLAVILRDMPREAQQELLAAKRFLQQSRQAAAPPPQLPPAQRQILAARQFLARWG